MTTDVAWIEDAIERLNRGESKVFLDFASVLRIDGSALRALEELAGVADARSARVVLRAVHPDVYRVLKELKLADRFSFLT